jgi:xylose isomerase
VDTIAHALIKAAAIIEDGKLDAFRAERYAGWKGPLGDMIRSGSLADIADHTVAKDLAPQRKSGRQEWLENLVNRY